MCGLQIIWNIIMQKSSCYDQSWKILSDLAMDHLINICWYEAFWNNKNTKKHIMGKDSYCKVPEHFQMEEN